MIWVPKIAMNPITSIFANLEHAKKLSMVVKMKWMEWNKKYFCSFRSESLLVIVLHLKVS